MFAICSSLPWPHSILQFSSRNCIRTRVFYDLLDHITLHTSISNYLCGLHCPTGIVSFLLDGVTILSTTRDSAVSIINCSLPKFSFTSLYRFPELLWTIVLVHPCVQPSMAARQVEDERYILVTRSEADVRFFRSPVWRSVTMACICHPSEVFIRASLATCVKPLVADCRISTMIADSWSSFSD